MGKMGFLVQMTNITLFNVHELLKDAFVALFRHEKKGGSPMEAYTNVLSEPSPGLVLA